DQYDTYVHDGYSSFILPFLMKSSKVIEIVAAHGIVFALAGSGVCAAFSRGSWTSDSDEILGTVLEILGSLACKVITCMALVVPDLTVCCNWGPDVVYTSLNFFAECHENEEVSAFLHQSFHPNGSPNGGIVIENLVAIQVSNFNHAISLYRLGSQLRSTASTNSNKVSSRSHCLKEEDLCETACSLNFALPLTSIRLGKTEPNIIRERDPSHRMVKRTKWLRSRMVATSTLEPGSFYGDKLLSWCLRIPFIDRYLLQLQHLLVSSQRKRLH
ncbi:kinesin-like protein KIN-14T, partial [Tanacetum coccineum]